MIRKIDHLVITTVNENACLEFYRALGFDVRQGEGRSELYAGDFKINVHVKGRELEPKAGTVMTGSADICLETGLAMEQLELLLRQKGLSPELGPVVRHGVRGVMDSVYLRDPDGNLVELCHYREKTK